MPPSTPATPSPRPVRVLLVEDDDLMRRSFTVALERYGYHIAAAADGLEGLELFREESFDLLVLDVMLPGLDGIGLCRRVRETSLVPVLMMSARGDGLDVVAGPEAGADDYVVKPVDTVRAGGTDPLAAAAGDLRARSATSDGPRAEGRHRPRTRCWSSGTWPSTPAALRCSSPGARSR